MCVGISFEFHRIVERSAMNSTKMSEKHSKTQVPQVSNSITWQGALRDIRVVTYLQLIAVTGVTELGGI